MARFLLVTEPGDFAGFVRALAEPAPGPELPPGPATPPDMELEMKTAAEYGLEILGPRHPGLTRRRQNMSIETLSKSASTQNRLAARQWVDAFDARDDEGEADARTAGYIAHAPDSMHLPALDSDAWVAFLGTFLEGFPDLHLEVQDTVADEEMTAQRILFTGTHTGPFRGLPPTGRKVRFSGLEMSRMAGGRPPSTGSRWTRSRCSSSWLRVVRAPDCYHES